jgi:allene oxide cyclase
MTKAPRVLAAAVLAAGALIVGCGGDDDDDETTTIAVVERAETDVLQHVGPANEDDSVGDVLGFANNLYDEQNQEKVGTDNGMCMRTAPGEAFECVWTATLEGGQITVEGPFYDAKDSTLAITGGTGDYADASGEMTLHARNDQGTEYDFTYKINSE